MRRSALPSAPSLAWLVARLSCRDGHAGRCNTVSLALLILLITLLMCCCGGDFGNHEGHASRPGKCVQQMRLRKRKRCRRGYSAKIDGATPLADNKPPPAASHIRQGRWILCAAIGAAVVTYGATGLGSHELGWPTRAMAITCPSTD